MYVCMWKWESNTEREKKEGQERKTKRGRENERERLGLYGSVLFLLQYFTLMDKVFIKQFDLIDLATKD